MNMKKLVLGLALAALTSGAIAAQVDGYVRKDGTYVPPHYRTDPNSTRTDNWSSQGNVNPYTGKPGTVNPYSPPPPPAPYQPYNPYK